MTVPGVGDERELLAGTLVMLREAIIGKADGLTDEQARWTPDRALISLIGIINHLAHVEWRWIDGALHGAEVSRSEAEFVVADVTLAQAIDNYRARGSRTDEAIGAAPSLDHRGQGERGSAVDLRWILVHLIQETARHAGHADATRELLDGVKGN